MRWTRSIAPAFGMAFVLALAGCGGGSNTGSSQSIATRIRPGLASTACSAAVASAAELRSVPTAFTHLSGPPFGVATTGDGRWSFVDLVGGGVDVFSDGGFAPRLVRTIGVPGDSLGNSLTRDGRYLLLANGGDGATVLSTARAESGAAHPVIGTLSAASTGGGGGAIEVASSPDGGYAFVSVEDGDEVAVYDLRAALADDFRRSAYIGVIPLGLAVVGLAVSPDGRWLYATSEVAAAAAGQLGGTLSVISVARAERDPARSVLATIPAHCSPVRVAVSADGGTVWVTARGSDQLLAFAAPRLRTDPAHALLAAVRVGEAPVGLALVDGGREVIVADSNRFGAAGQHSELTVVGTVAALAGRPSVLGTIPAGSFPREMALEPNGRTLLVGNFASDQLEAVGLSHLP